MSNLVFPLDIAGAQPNLTRVPMFSTGVQTSASGAEMRASWQSFPRYKYTLSIEVLRSDPVYQDFQRVSSAFAASLGQYDSFLIVDPNDSVATNMGFAVTDGFSSAYQLQRTLGGPQRSGYWDPIAYPINSVPRSNYLLNSQNFVLSPWTLTNTELVISASQMAPDGTQSMFALENSVATSVPHWITQTVNIASAATPGQSYTFSAYINTANSQAAYAVLEMQEGTGSTVASATFNLATQAVTATAAGTNWSNVTASVASLGFGNWVRLAVTATKTNNATTIASYLLPSTASGSTFAAGVGFQGLFFWGLQLEIGSAATQYQGTTSTIVTDTPSYWPNFGDGFEPVTEVNAASLQLSIAGTPKVLNIDYSYLGAGLVNLGSVPASGQALTWSGNYFRRVRFDNDDMSLQRIFGQLWSGKSVEFISTK